MLGTFRQYVFLSVLTGVGCVGNAFVKNKQLYLAVVYLTSSKVNAVLIANLALAISLCFANMLKYLFFGKLHHSEVEKVYERAWYAVTETLLAITIFREEFDFGFVAQFVGLFICKVFHWCMQERLDYIESTREVSWATFLRMATLMGTLAFVDANALQFCIAHTRDHGPTAKMLFAFEYGILGLTVISTSCKFGLFLFEQYVKNGRWEHRPLVSLVLDLVANLVHVIAYGVFFCAIFTYYGIPLHIMRDLYFTMTQFCQRCVDFSKYRTAVRRLRTEFPDVTPEELEAMGDDKCAICFDQMNLTSKRLPCGHCFHFDCLRGWIEQRRVCPVCNADVLDENGHYRGGHAEHEVQRYLQRRGLATPQADTPGAAPAGGTEFSSSHTSAATHPGDIVRDDEAEILTGASTVTNQPETANDEPLSTSHSERDSFQTSQRLSTADGSGPAERLNTQGMLREDSDQVLGVNSAVQSPAARAALERQMRAAAAAAEVGQQGVEGEDQSNRDSGSTATQQSQQHEQKVEQHQQQQERHETQVKQEQEQQGQQQFYSGMPSLGSNVTDLVSLAAQGAEPFQVYLRRQAEQGRPDLTTQHLHMYYSAYIQSLAAINLSLNSQLASRPEETKKEK